ncbi:MAG: succinate dehydrogenase, cytochrome b556 subunit [Alphaproteobacteria bacterium]|nr:succinate dehydrogenase, cytochrome b556 subunit [Alphaproteobacteria bacterium]MBP9777245.1 succinate dehydrogenase, cytochrome b556 subunit [Alphaproteobacteria bacterium]
MSSLLKKKRPLSPHLQIYKIQITSLLSIIHRGTGIVLYAGAILWTLWFVALAEGPQTYAQMQSFLLSPFGLMILASWSFSFFYHLCNGIRHLAWDLGIGYEMSTVRLSGGLVVVTSLLLSCIAWMIGIWAGGIYT